MKNFIESGDYFEVVLEEDTAPGTLIIVGELIGIAVNGGKAGETTACRRRCVAELPKSSGAIGQGDKAYWKADEKAVVKAATGNTLIGCAHLAAVADAELVAVALKG